MKVPVGRQYAPTQQFTWRGWHIDIAALSGPAYQVDAASKRNAAGEYVSLTFYCAKSLPPAVIASGIMYQLRRYEGVVNQEGTDNV